MRSKSSAKRQKHVGEIFSAVPTPVRQIRLTADDSTMSLPRE
jgi:hypothetical protein